MDVDYLNSSTLSSFLGALESTTTEKIEDMNTNDTVRETFKRVIETKTMVRSINY